MTPPSGPGNIANISRLLLRLWRPSTQPQELQKLCRRYSSSDNGVWKTNSRRYRGSGLARVRSPTSRPGSITWAPGRSRSYSAASARLDVATEASKPSSERSDPQPDEISEAVRQLMRHVPHPVAVITATDLSLSPEGGPEGWRGATVSSFNTVTLLPRPVVSFNIKKLSSTFDAIRSSGHFYVHLLSEDAREGPRIAAKFTRGNASYPFHDDNGELERFALVSEAQPDLKKLPPILHFENDAGDLVVPFRLHCRYLADKVVEIGDHVVLFGEVDHVFYDDGAFYEQSPFSPIFCLAYVDGLYCRVFTQSPLFEP